MEFLDVCGSVWEAAGDASSTLKGPEEQCQVKMFIYRVVVWKMYIVRWNPLLYEEY